MQEWRGGKHSCTWQKRDRRRGWQLASQEKRRWSQGVQTQRATDRRADSVLSWFRTMPSQNKNTHALSLCSPLTPACWSPPPPPSHYTQLTANPRRPFPANQRFLEKLPPISERSHNTHTHRGVRESERAHESNEEKERVQQREEMSREKKKQPRGGGERDYPIDRATGKAQERMNWLKNEFTATLSMY